MRFGSLLMLLAIPAAAQDLDLLIRGGRIVDGSGNPGFVGDLGIRAGKIVLMGRSEAARAVRTIDASGLTVTPGFIVIHNHSDFTIVEDGNAQSMIRQGVTSLILGEGGSAAPGKRWADFKAYFDQLLRQGISTNVGTYVGSSEIWTWVHGQKAGPPAPEELERMRA